MTRATRWIALIVSTTLAGSAVAAEKASPVTRLGKTVVRYQDDAVKAVVSWRFANQTFEKEPWLLLELAFAAEGKALNLNREDVALLGPDGERIPLPGQKRFAERMNDPLQLVRRASVARDPLDNYFSRPTRLESLRFFTVPGGPVVQDEVSGGPSWLIQGDLFFEAPNGVWKPGSYTLVLKNKTMDVALPFSLPAGELKKDAKGSDDKVVPW